MSMNPFPEEWQLISLFECEPTLADEDAPWAYNGLTFDTTRGEDHVVCEIEPGYEVVRIQWSRDGREVVNLELNRVCSLSVSVEHGREALVGDFRNDDILPFRLRLKPAVHLLWGTDD